MKNYYDILGVTLQSGEDEIKRAYRQQAILLHPDKNPLPEAEAAFKEVNAAYEVLSDPVARHMYNQMLTQSISSLPAQPLHRDPAYRKRQESGYKAQRPSAPSESFLLMQRSLPLLKRLAWLGCACCLLFWMDYSLPTKISEERVLTDPRSIREIAFRNLKADFLVTDKGHHFPVSYDAIKNFPFGSTVKVHTSSFLGILVTVENEKDYRLTNLATIYGNFSFAPVLLFVLSMISISKKWGMEFQFNLGIVIALIFMLNGAFLFMSIL
ncbi:MAG: J domain-containing protein [Bacteroidia bacterium]|nr:J domain-containing protein [Bacteroidia bacterium]